MVSQDKIKKFLEENRGKKFRESDLRKVFNTDNINKQMLQLRKFGFVKYENKKVMCDSGKQMVHTGFYWVE